MYILITASVNVTVLRTRTKPEVRPVVLSKLLMSNYARPNHGSNQKVDMVDICVFVIRNQTEEFNEFAG